MVYFHLQYARIRDVAERLVCFVRFQVLSQPFDYVLSTVVLYLPQGEDR